MGFDNVKEVDRPPSIKDNSRVSGGWWLVRGWMEIVFEVLPQEQCIYAKKYNIIWSPQNVYLVRISTPVRIWHSGLWCGVCVCVCVCISASLLFETRSDDITKGYEPTLNELSSKLRHILHQQGNLSRIIPQMQGNKLTHLKCSQHTIYTFYQIFQLVSGFLW